MRTDRAYTGFANDVETASLMLNARTGFALASSIEGYAGLGLGIIQVGYAGTGPDAPFFGEDIVAGGQISFGARYSLGSGSFFSELKHPRAFEDDSIESVADTDVAQSYDSTSVIIGYGFDF